MVLAIMGTTRFCSSKSFGNQCQYVDFPDHNRIYRSCVFTCDQDGCNSTGLFTVPTYINLLFLMATSFINFVI